MVGTRLVAVALGGALGAAGCTTYNPATGQYESNPAATSALVGGLGMAGGVALGAALADDDDYCCWGGGWHGGGGYHHNNYHRTNNYYVDRNVNRNVDRNRNVRYHQKPRTGSWGTAKQRGGGGGRRGGGGGGRRR